MTYRTEFPEFAPAWMPALPEGFEDVSWRNDACPQFWSQALRLSVWTDHIDPEHRQLEGDAPPRRFLAYGTVEEDCSFASDQPLLETDDWPAVLDLIATHQMAERFFHLLGDDLTFNQIAEVRRLNATPKYSRACASHDFCDANMVMWQAFVDTMEREPVLGDAPGAEADDDLMGAAWDIARKRHLIAEAV